MTGLAQVSGRNAITWEEKFFHDVRYVENVIFFLDVQIVISTVKKVLKHDGITSDSSATMEEFKGTEREYSVR